MVIRADADGEVLIAVIEEERALPETIVRDIAKRFPLEDRAVKKKQEREQFLKDALLKHSTEYKLVAA